MNHQLLFVLGAAHGDREVVWRERRFRCGGFGQKCRSAYGASGRQSQVSRRCFVDGDRLGPQFGNGFESASEMPGHIGFSGECHGDAP